MLKTLAITMKQVLILTFCFAVFFEVEGDGTAKVLNEIVSADTTSVLIFSEMNDVASMDYVKKNFDECRGLIEGERTFQVHGCVTCKQERPSFVVDTKDGIPCVLTTPTEDMYELSFCHLNGTCSEIDQYSPNKPVCQDLESQNLTDVKQRILIVPESQKFCKVGNRILRRCRHPVSHIATVNWILYNKKIFFVDDLDLTYGLNPKLLSSYHCEGECQNKNCSKFGCHGDKIFCAHFHCFEKSACICTLKEGLQLARWRLHNGDLYPTCWGQIRVKVLSEYVNQWKDYSSALRHRFEQNPIRCNEFSSCKQGTIRLNSKDKRIRMISLRANGFRQMIDVDRTGLQTTFVIPSSFLMKYSNVTFSMMGENGKLKECVLQCLPVDECAPGSSDSVNAHYENSVKCWPMFKTMAVGIFTALFVVVEIILIIVMMDVGINVLFSTGRFSFVLNKVSKTLHSSSLSNSPINDTFSIRDLIPFASRRESDSSTDFIETDFQPQPSAPPKSPTSSVKAFPFNKLVEQTLKTRGVTSPDVLHAALGLTIVTCIITLASACSETHIIVSDRQACELISQTTKACEFYSTSRIQIPSMDQEICLTLQHDDESYGYLKIKSKEIHLTCQKEISYWTSDISLNCVNENYCPGFGDFCTMSGCSQQIEDYMKSDRFGNSISVGQCQNMDPDLLTQGCFFSIASMIFSPKACFITVASFDAKPQTVTPAIGCNSWLISAEIDMTLNLNGSEHTLSVNLSQQNSLIQDKLKLELVSKNVPEWVNLPSCYISFNNYTYGTTCNQRGTFVKEKIGAIQCPTKTDAETLSKNCKFNEDIVKFHNQQCILKTPSFDQMASIKRLPLVRPEFYLFDSGNLTITARLSSEFSIEAQLVLEGLSVNIDYARPKCIMHKLTFDGCYNCASGVLAKMNLVVTQRGVVKILCPEVPITIPLAVSRSQTNYEFRFRFPKKHVDMICQLKCSNELQFEMKGTLRDGEIIIDDPAGRTHHGVTTKTKSFFSSLYNSILALLESFGLSHLFEWFQIGFLVFVSVFFLMLFLSLLRLVCRTRRTRNDLRSTTKNISKIVTRMFKENEKKHSRDLKKKDDQLKKAERMLKENYRKGIQDGHDKAVAAIKKINERNKHFRNVSFVEEHDL